MRTLFVTLGILLAALAGGCAGAPDAVLPTCARIAVPSAANPQKEYLAQGLWLGNHLLTALHPFTQERGTAPPRSIELGGFEVEVRSFQSGDTSVVEWLYSPGAERHFEDFAHDWALLGVSLAGPRDGAIARGDGRVVPGERLYVIGYEPRTTRDHTSAVPVRVLNARPDEPLPEGIFAIDAPPGQAGPGWSGAVVARPSSGQGWEFVGILISENMTIQGARSYHLVLRPPASALDRLFGRS